MYFNRAMNKKGVCVGVILFSLMGDWILIIKRLDFEVTNSILECEACIYGLEALIAIGIRKEEILGDSKLVILQVNKEWEVREDKFKLYFEYIKGLKKYFNELKLKFKKSNYILNHIN